MSVPLDRPLYGATFGQAISRLFANYVKFSGRASRSEFWWAYLFAWILMVIGLALTLTMASPHVDPSTGQLIEDPASTLFRVIFAIAAVVIFIPQLAVTWRRFHDTDRSGGSFFISLVPFVGGILLLVWLAFGSNPAGARFDRV